MVCKLGGSCQKEVHIELPWMARRTLLFPDIHLVKEKWFVNIEMVGMLGLLRSNYGKTLVRRFTQRMDLRERSGVTCVNLHFRSVGITCINLCQRPQDLRA